MPREGTRELRNFIKEHGKFDRDTRTWIRKRMRESAQPVLANAKSNASWSTRIPGAIKLSISLTTRRTGVSLRVNRKKAPHGRPYENLGKPGKFRHPFFGDRTRWFEQPARPFFFRAAEPWITKIDSEIGDIVDEVARRHKFK